MREMREPAGELWFSSIIYHLGIGLCPNDERKGLPFRERSLPLGGSASASPSLKATNLVARRAGEAGTLGKAGPFPDWLVSLADRRPHAPVSPRRAEKLCFSEHCP